jgi:hypothetical protein
MARIMPALKTYNNVRALRQPIYDLTFTFIAPLRTDDNYVAHEISPF